MLEAFTKEKIWYPQHTRLLWANNDFFAVFAKNQEIVHTLNAPE